MMQTFFSFIKKRSKLRHPKTVIIVFWVPALMKNGNNYKVKLKFHLFWFIKNALFKVLIDSFQQKLLKLNGSKDSNGRVVYTEPGNPDIINNAILNIFSSIIDLAGSPVLIRAVRTARTEWKKHKLGRGKAVEPIIVVVDSAVHGDALGVPGDVDNGGQVGREDDEAYMLIEHFFGGPEGPDVNNIDRVNDNNLTTDDSVNEGKEEARLLEYFWQACSALWCRASKDIEDKQLSILESIQIRIQQFWPFRFSNSSEGKSRIRPLFKVKTFVALNIWQDYISEILIKEIAILHIVVLIKFFSLFKTHFSFAVAAVWIPEIGTSSSSSSASVPRPILGTNLNASPINVFFTSPSSLEVGKLALPIGGWRIVARSLNLKTLWNKISFSFIKFKFDVLSLLFTFSADVFVLMGRKFQFSSPNLSEIYIHYVSLSLSSLSLDDPEFAFQTWSTRTMPTLGLWSRTASLKTTVHCWVEFFCTILCEININFSGTFCKTFHFFSLFLLDNLGI